MGYAVAGLFIGLVGGPFLLYVLGMLVLSIRGRQQEKLIRKMRMAHNEKVCKLRKEYESYRKRFTKTTVKIERIISKAREEYQ